MSCFFSEGSETEKCPVNEACYLLRIVSAASPPNRFILRLLSACFLPGHLTWCGRTGTEPAAAGAPLGPGSTGRQRWAVRAKPPRERHPPAATRASRKPRSQPSASSTSTASRNSAAAAVTPFSSSFRTLSFTSSKKAAQAVRGPGRGRGGGRGGSAAGGSHRRTASPSCG